MVAHTKAYIKVLIPEEVELQGKRIVVKIHEIHRFHVVGEVIDRNPAFITDSLSPIEIRERMNSIYQHFYVFFLTNNSIYYFNYPSIH